MAPALGPEIYARGFRFSPTPQEAVTYYLPRLVSGDPQELHDVVRPVIHRAQVYACDAADLARRFRPMPRTHNRFFFTVANKGVRAAGAGSWNGQSTVDIKDGEGVQIGELRKFRYKKKRDGSGVLTDWLMDEYSSCALDGAGGLQPVLCKVYVSPKAAPNSDAYKESAACFATRPSVAPAVEPVAVAAKRPAPPPPLQDAMSPCAKRMRGSVLQPAGGNASLPPPPRPSVLPAAPIRAPLATVRKMPFAPPQPSCAPHRGSMTPSATQPLPASALPLAPAAPTRAPLAAVRKMPFAPPRPPCAPRHGSAAPSATQPSPASALPLAHAAPTRPPLAAVQKTPFAPPQPSCAPRRGSTAPAATQPSPASSLPMTPAAPTRPPLAAVRKMSFAPPLPCAPCRGSTTPLATQPLAASAPPLAPAAPTRPAVQPRGSPMPLPPPPRPLAQPKEQVPLTTTPVASGSHMPKQALVPPPCPPQLSIQLEQRRTILDPFEAAMVREGAQVEEQTVAAAPAMLEDDRDNDDDLAKVIEDMLSDDEEEPALEFDIDDDDFAKEMEGMLSAEAGKPALEFDVDAAFDFSEEDLEATARSMPASS